MVAALPGTAVSCDRPAYDDPSSLIVPVEAMSVVVAGDGTITIDTGIQLPDPPRPDADALERVEISIRGAGGTEYLRAVYNASSVSVNPVTEFGLYPVGEMAEPGFDDAVGDSHDADTLWGAIHRDTEAVRSGTRLSIRWVVSLLDVAPGDYEVHAKAVPGGQRDRDWMPVATFTLRPESNEDAGIHRSTLDDVLSAGVITTGEASFSVDDLWTLYVALLGQPDKMAATAGHAGEPSFLRLLSLVTERGRDPGPGTDLTEPAMPAVDIAAAAIDPDPWLSAPALWLARKQGVSLDAAAIIDRLDSWDPVAVDQALLYLAAVRGETAQMLFRGSPFAEELQPRIWTGFGDECILEVFLGDDPSGERSVRLQRPTKAGMDITAGGEPLYGWDGESPIRVEPGDYTISYLLGDPPVIAGPVTVECPPGGSARVVLWLRGGV